jgi:hypothetical protein
MLPLERLALFGMSNKLVTCEVREWWLCERFVLEVVGMLEARCQHRGHGQFGMVA